MSAESKEKEVPNEQAYYNLATAFAVYKMMQGNYAHESDEKQMERLASYYINAADAFADMHWFQGFPRVVEED